MRGGPGAARNFGIKRAKGDIIAFTDDDCIIPPDWLKNIYDSFINNPGIAGVEGKTITLINETHPLSHQIVNYNPCGIFPTCNMAYKKQILEKLGGFYGKFKHPYGEDIDLAWNVLKYGEVPFNDSMIVTHPVYRKGIFEKLLRTCYLSDEFILFNRHIELYKKFRCKNPWVLIYFYTYIKDNCFFLKKYMKHKKMKAFSILSIEIIVFLILQGLLLFFLAFFFIYRHKEK
jgi:glycosyltransferase involved in cell wall biosynthesis